MKRLRDYRRAIKAVPINMPQPDNNKCAAMMEEVSYICICYVSNIHIYILLYIVRKHVAVVCMRSVCFVKASTVIMLQFV